MEVWENKKCCGNTSRRRLFPQLFEFSQTFKSVSIKQLDYDMIKIDTLKWAKSGRHFVSKGILLRYSLSITALHPSQSA